MTDQGVPFGTAQYPIYFNEPSGTYFRAGHERFQEEWDSETGTWNNVFGTVEGKEKVWDGVPFTGSWSCPRASRPRSWATPDGSVLTTSRKPGETVQVAKVQMAGASSRRC
jgi:hypothetical protein